MKISVEFVKRLIAITKCNENLIVSVVGLEGVGMSYCSLEFMNQMRQSGVK